MDIIELPPFIRNAKKLLNNTDREELKAFLTQHPNKGSVIPGTGGLRKLRWSAKGKGKRGGARIIYFYYQIKNRIYLFTCYSKNEQTDLRPEIKKQLKTMLDSLKKGNH